MGEGVVVGGRTVSVASAGDGLQDERSSPLEKHRLTLAMRKDSIGAWRGEQRKDHSKDRQRDHAQVLCGLAH